MGEAGVNIQSVAPILTAVYIVGGDAFGVLNLIVPVTLLATVFIVRMRSVGGQVYAVFLVVATLTSLVMDLQHIYAGLDNPVNPPPTETLVLLLSVFACLTLASSSVWAKKNTLALPLTLMLITEAVGLAYVLGNVVTANYGVQLGSAVAGALASSEPYLGGIAGIGFTVLGGRQIALRPGKTRYLYVATLAFGALVEYLIMSNVLAGSSIVLGTIIIYDFGFLGVTNSNVVFLVLAAISSFITGWYLLASSSKPRDHVFYYGLASLILIVTGLVFDSEVVTTYILLPLVAASVVVSYNESHPKIPNLAGNQIAQLYWDSRQQ